jgi:hypothetical protein
MRVIDIERGRPIDDGECDAAGQAREMAHRRDHDLVDEQTDHNGRSAQQNIVDEAHDAAEAVIAAVFGHVGTGKNAYRSADRDGEDRQNQTSDDRIEQPAARPGRRRHLREHRK